MRSVRLLSGTDFRRKLLKRAVVRDTSERIIGRHGSMLILEVRDERGRKALRYLREGTDNVGQVR